MDKIINTELSSLKYLDISELKVPFIAVYEHPEDFPNDIVARVYDTDKPTNVIIIRQTAGEVEREVKSHFPQAHYIPRGPEDVPCLLGAWVL